MDLQVPLIIRKMNRADEHYSTTGTTELKLQRQLPFHTRRDAWVEIDLSAIEHNVTLIKKQLPEGMTMMAVLKADAYGHGAPLVLPSLEASGVGMVGVAAMDEALQLRETGTALPILVLGATPDWSMHEAQRHDIQMTIFCEQHLLSLERLYQSTQLPTHVHIKVDTGMHRIGVAYTEALPFIERCQQSPAVVVEGVFSHLACAADAGFSQTQIQRWKTLISQLPHRPKWLHLANSDGALRYDTQSWSNMVRVGIPLFGYGADPTTPITGLQPAMGLKARVVHIQSVPPGEGISYNHSYINQTQQPIRVATLPLGYADGVPRGLSNHLKGAFHGTVLHQVGTITMDQLMIDITPAGDCQVGDVITLLGRSNGLVLDLEDWAKTLGTIEYELMCGLRVRLPKTAARTAALV